MQFLPDILPLLNNGVANQKHFFVLICSLFDTSLVTWAIKSVNLTKKRKIHLKLRKKGKVIPRKISVANMIEVLLTRICITLANFSSLEGSLKAG